MLLALPRLLDSEVVPLLGSRGSLVRRWRFGMVDDGAIRSACGLDGLERDDDLEPLRPVSLESGAVRFLKQSARDQTHKQATHLFLITSVLSDRGRTTPCSL